MARLAGPAVAAFALLLAACASAPTPERARLSLAAPPTGPVENRPSDPPMSRIVVAVGGDAHSQTFVVAESPEAAERNRATLIGLYRRLASLEGMWGVRIAPEWREAPLEASLRAVGEEGSEEEIKAVFGGGNAYFLDATYLAAPVAEPDENVYPAIDALPPPEDAGAAEEN